MGVVRESLFNNYYHQMSSVRKSVNEQSTNTEQSSDTVGTVLNDSVKQIATKNTYLPPDSSAVAELKARIDNIFNWEIRARLEWIGKGPMRGVELSLPRVLFFISITFLA